MGTTMKLDISSNEIRISFSGPNEEGYIHTLISRLIFVFEPEITTWVHGVKVIGNATQVGSEDVT